MRAVDIILKKRSGQELSREEIEFFIMGLVNKQIPDYQASALLMAIYFNKLNNRETVDLTRAMMHSGDVMDLSGINGIKVDKHSTGGVGDKTTLIVGPLVAAAGLKVAKMSGRGMGHSGGTLDKLLSFTGYSFEIPPEQFLQNIETCGISVIGQSGNLVPADKIIYALRDVTGTVDQISLIASSIMSKKLAAGADAIVLDVKTGKGSFMPTKEMAFKLAEIMVNIGKSMGRKVEAIITDMEQPLGNYIGNALEVREAVQTLKGNGPDDLIEVSLELAGALLVLGEKADSMDEAKAILQEKIASGEALEKLRTMVSLQGGSTEIIDHPENIPPAKYYHEVLSQESGFISRLDAKTIGEASMLLGAGRATKESKIDLNSGIILLKKAGDKVEAEEPIAALYGKGEAELQIGLTHFQSAVSISSQPPPIRPLVFGKVS